MRVLVCCGPLSLCARVCMYAGLNACRITQARASDMEFVVEAALMIAERAGEDDEFAQYVVTIVIDEAGVST
jgi:hypothetical protein